jgi:transcriptional regulator with XRE-family HTH domain
MIGQRLRQIRLASSLSLEGLAAKLGGIVTKQALSKYEKGLTQPSPKVLNRLAAVLGVKSADLYREPELDIQFVAYRKLSKLPQREQDRVEGIVHLNLEKRYRLQTLTHPCSQVKLPVLELPITTVEDTEDAAGQLRSRWDLGTDPIANLIGVLENHYVHVVSVEAKDGFDGLSAVAYDDARTPVAAAVVSSNGVAGERQRLNLAHELGHLVLKVPDDIDEEKAAFRFGAAFLAPAELVFEEVGRKRTSIEREELLLLKQKLGLSIQAILYRLLDLGIITKSYHQSWCIRLNQLGWRKQEPEALPNEHPQWLRQNVLRALAEQLITQEEASILLQEQISLAHPQSQVSRQEFMKLPLAERQRILEQQAEAMADYYETETEWRDFQGGDFIDYETAASY